MFLGGTMKTIKLLTAILSLLNCQYLLNAQISYTSVSYGYWNDPNSWSSTGVFSDEDNFIPELFNVFGKRVNVLISESLPSGKHTINWNAAKFKSGYYVCKLRINGFTETRKLIISK